MESRHSMVIGGAAVVVITLAVASAVTITNAAALRDSSGQALAASTITLPAGHAVATASESAPKVVAPAHAPSSDPSKSSKTTTAELVPAPEAATISTPHAAPAVTAQASSSSVTTKKQSSGQPAQSGGQPAQSDQSTAKAKHHGHGGASVKSQNVIHPRALLRIAQTPVLVTGHESGAKESPSSAAGSKKGQSPHSPDARD